MSARDALATVGLDLLVRTWSPGAEAVFGWTSAEAVGRPLGEVVGPALNASALFDEVRATGSATARRIESTKKGGARLAGSSRG